MREKTQLSLDLDKPCNHCELRLEDGVGHGKHLTDGKIILYSEIWADGRHIDEPHFIDLPLLVQSLHEQRWFDIFTCGFGVGGGASIVDGIQVTHDKGLVRWSFRQPQSSGNLVDPELSEWENSAVPVELTFERTEMVRAHLIRLREGGALTMQELNARQT
ncbi:hypothetical protein [Hydrogenophaga atypica]|uniref:Uncharacterized protein n=1 Tax=Hydrogenophaga atypica TaxID=249409 RepID=A0ABW2QLQ0_9BURK